MFNYWIKGKQIINNQSVKDKKKSQLKKTNVDFLIKIAATISVILVFAGIWNAYHTGQIADQKIEKSLELQKVSASIKREYNEISSAVNFALTSGDRLWNNRYEKSLLELNKSLHISSKLGDKSFPTKTQKSLSEISLLDREIFNLISNKKNNQAFSLFSSSDYQVIRFTLAKDVSETSLNLNQQAEIIITSLKNRVLKTTLILILQVFAIIGIWLYVLSMLKLWRKEQNIHSKELIKLAHYDSLTGIGNRALFKIRLEAAFKQSRRDSKAVGLMLMDLDHFKEINDSLGHGVGDELLIKVADKLKTISRESDTVIRLGGDEFAIIVTNINTQLDAMRLGEKILSIFENPMQIKQHEIKTSTSIGLSFYPDDAINSEELLRKADMALYEAKRMGRSQVKFFDAKIDIAARNKAQIQDEILIGLEKNQFSLHYQPIIDIKTNKVISVESLLRWDHPTKGSIPADTFIPIAEESRLIIELGSWVAKTACEQQVAWENKNFGSLNIAINLSPVQFHQENLLNEFDELVKQTGIKKDKLTIEITESTLMENRHDLINKLHALRSLGIKLAIDDFGTGYSSLAYLKRFPINYLKIDKEFTRELPNNTHDISISRSIIKMAHELGINVIAEGIENTQQLQFLGKSNCDSAQGFLIAKPMSKENFEDWFTTYNSIPASNVHSIKKTS
jgi:diguanylate cyclase (GGDEF)-like protein